MYEEHCTATDTMRGMVHAGILHRMFFWIFSGLLGCLSTTAWLWTFAAQINLGIGQLSGECVCVCVCVCIGNGLYLHKHISKSFSKSINNDNYCESGEVRYPATHSYSSVALYYTVHCSVMFSIMVAV